ncbi:hypothetical protein MPSEU_000177100 [Mayamaea pseudoterrestris]|nr:hypothetical protein MPSEU_000177100 [Mayamaea pseudoterrestris]
MTDQSHCNDSDSDDDDDSVIAFSKLNMIGVDFDAAAAAATDLNEQTVQAIDKGICLGDYSVLRDECIPSSLRVLGKMLARGDYAEALRGASARALLPSNTSIQADATVTSVMRERVTQQMCTSIIHYLELQLLGIAALNLFLQANYTGPSLSEERHLAALADVNPHACFFERLEAKSTSSSGEEAKTRDDVKMTAPKRNVNYQNAVLSELVVEGEWPCQVCVHPYFLLLARSILLPLADPQKRFDWTRSCNIDEEVTARSFNSAFPAYASTLQSAKLWSARAAIAHERLLQSRAPCMTLHREVEWCYQSVAASCNDTMYGMPNTLLATIWLEHGLAEHHFERPAKGKTSFVKAMKHSGLQVSVTGALGKRTKYQQDAKAQYLVNAISTVSTSDPLVEAKQGDDDDDASTLVKKQMIEHSEEEILLERVKFENDKENEIAELNVLDQTILLALCLDVKNNNPNDGLTAEEMGAYLMRVLDHHNNWMVYSTGLLERSWLEFERSHARERAILQMQALADQHTQRLTMTQSTRESIDESAPVQDRLKMIHCLVYPPRWVMIQDLADRYASLGIVTSAAELFLDIEMWDDVVDCYRRAGKTNLAEQVVRERLDIHETPRMWSALGDLLNDPSYYQKAIEVSNGRFYQAYVSLGAYCYANQDFAEAIVNYEAALKLRPLQPAVWFRLGTLGMQLERWDLALKAFSEVVQQEPEEGEAWANVAAIHLRNKQPAEAYPALNEALKYNRKNWRIWVSKLYTCLDLEKCDEAVQSCNILLDLQATNRATDGVPFVEAKCVRAIVGGALSQFEATKDDPVAVESSHRTLSRVYELLCRISTSSDANDAWIFETLAFFHEQIGQDDKVLDYLMKEYRSLSGIAGWEKNDYNLRKVCGVVSHISHIYCTKTDRESFIKAKFILRGVLKTIQLARPDDLGIADEVESLKKAQTDVEERLSKI